MSSLRAGRESLPIERVRLWQAGFLKDFDPAAHQNTHGGFSSTACGAGLVLLERALLRKQIRSKAAHPVLGFAWPMMFTITPALLRGHVARRKKRLMRTLAAWA